MQVAGLCYANHYLTDGFIPAAAVPTLMDFSELDKHAFNGIGNVCALAVQKLVDAGIWHNKEGGYYIHDYSDYQPTKAQVEAERALKVAAGQAGGQASAKARAQANFKQNLNGISTDGQAEFNPVPVPVPVPGPVPKPKTLSPKTTPLPPSGGKQRNGEITPEFIEQMVVEWGPKLGGEQATRETISAALNHKAADKYKDKRLYLKGWLRRDAERRPPGANDNGNGRASLYNDPFIQAARDNGSLIE